MLSTKEPILTLWKPDKELSILLRFYIPTILLKLERNYVSNSSIYWSVLLSKTSFVATNATQRKPTVNFNGQILPKKSAFNSTTLILL